MADTLQDKIAAIDADIYQKVAAKYSVGEEEVRQVFNEFANKPVNTKAGTSKTMGERFSSLFKRKQSNKISPNEGETQSSPEKIIKDSEIFKEVYIKKQEAIYNKTKGGDEKKIKGGDEKKTLTLDQFNEIEKIRQGLFPKGDEYNRFFAALINIRGFGLESAEKKELDLIDLGDINSDKALNIKYGRDNGSLKFNRTDPNPRSPRYVDTSIDDPYYKSVGIKDDIYSRWIKRKDDPNTPSYLMEREILSRFTDNPVTTKKDFDAVFDKYKFSSPNAKASYKLDALKQFVAHGEDGLVKEIYDDVYNRKDFGDNGYSLAHEKFDNEIRRPNSHDPHPTLRKNEQEKAVAVLRSIPEKGGNDEKRESKSITGDQKKGRERALEYIVTKTFFRDGENAKSGLDVQFTRVHDFKAIYEKAEPSFQDEIKTALKVSLEKSLSGEYEKKYHVNGISRTSDGKQAHPIEKFTQLAKEIGVDLRDPAYTKALFDGKGKEVEGTSVKIDPGHNLYLFWTEGGVIDKKAIGSNPENKEIVKKALDRYLLQDRNLGMIEKAIICGRNGQLDKLLYSFVPDALKPSTDKTSKGKLTAKSEEVPPSAPLKAPQVPGADGRSMQASPKAPLASFGTHVAGLGKDGGPSGRNMGG